MLKHPLAQGLNLGVVKSSKARAREAAGGEDAGVAPVSDCRLRDAQKHRGLAHI